MAEFTKFRCFLCRIRICNGSSVNDAYCPTSRKTLHSVFQYLASITKTELHISRDEMICFNCHELLINFDNTLFSVAKQQRHLSLLVQKAACGIDDESDWEQECNEHMNTLEELNDEHYFDDVEITDNEILLTVKDALGIKELPQQQQQQQYSFERKPTRQHLGQMVFDENQILTDKEAGRDVLPCPHCHMRFKSKFRLHKHVAHAHKKYGCELCNFRHSNEDYILLHMNVHEGRPETQCRFCSKIFTTKISTIRHMEIHLNNNKYQCDKCGLCFSQTTILYNHKLQHEAEEKPLSCGLCNQVFKTKRTYRHHMTTHRADRPRYSCEYCHKTFTEKYTLKVHKRTHDEYNTEETEQAAANIVVSENGDMLIVEVVNQDNNSNKYNCVICNREFATKEQQNKHMESKHDVILKSYETTTNNFVAEVTDVAQAAEVAEVTEVSEVEGVEIKKSCHICGISFSTHIDLEVHLRDLHNFIIKDERIIEDEEFSESFYVDATNK